MISYSRKANGLQCTFRSESAVEPDPIPSHRFASLSPRSQRRPHQEPCDHRLPFEYGSSQLSHNLDTAFSSTAPSLRAHISRNPTARFSPPGLRSDDSHHWERTRSIGRKNAPIASPQATYIPSAWERINLDSAITKVSPRQGTKPPIIATAPSLSTDNPWKRRPPFQALESPGLAQEKDCKSLIPITLQIVRRTSHGIRSGTVPQLRGGPLNKTPALC